MAMLIGYNDIVDTVVAMIEADSAFDITDTATRYIQQLLDQRKIPGPPLPAVLVYMAAKEEGASAHTSIGYSPSPILEVAIEVMVGLPGPCPAALKTALGLSTDITTPREADKAACFIIDKIESLFRADPRMSDALAPNETWYAIPGRTTFHEQNHSGQDIISAQHLLGVRIRLIERA